MFPDQNVLIVRRPGDPAGGDLTIVVAVCSRTGDVGCGLVVITRQGPKTIEKSEISRLDAVLLRDEITHACARDEFLTFQYAAQQQADDHQYDCYLDKRKTGLFFTHDPHPLENWNR